MKHAEEGEYFFFNAGWLIKLNNAIYFAYSENIKKKKKIFSSMQHNYKNCVMIQNNLWYYLFYLLKEKKIYSSLFSLKDWGAIRKIMQKKKILILSYTKNYGTPCSDMLKKKKIYSSLFRMKKSWGCSPKCWNFNTTYLFAKINALTNLSKWNIML